MTDTPTDNRNGGMRLSRLNFILALAGTTGIISLFLPFTVDVTPWMALSDSYMWKLGTPAFLTIPVTAAYLRLHYRGPFSVVEKWSLYAMALASAFITLWVIFMEVGFVPDWKEWFYSLVALLVMIAGTMILVSGAKKGRSVVNPVLAVQTAYLANCLMCLLAFFPTNEGLLDFTWQAGAWLSLVTALVYLAQILLITKQLTPVKPA